MHDLLHSALQAVWRHRRKLDLCSQTQISQNDKKGQLVHPVKALTSLQGALQV